MDKASGHPDDYPRVALVTGAARRIGRALAGDLARRGWAVGVHYRGSEREAESLVAAIRQAGGRAVAIQADLASESDAEALLPRVRRALGAPGLLVNNASTFDYDDVRSGDRDSWDAHIEPNLRAPLVLTQAFADGLPATAGGLVVNMLDARVLHPTARHLSYTVSKTALWAMTQSLAQALAPRIRVNAIGPGPILPAAGQSRQQFEARCRDLPLQRSASLDEVCAALRFLIAAKSVTGQMLALDGGDHLAARKARNTTQPMALRSLAGDTAA